MLLGVFPALQGLTVDFGNTKVTMQSSYLIIKHLIVCFWRLGQLENV